MDIVSKYNDVAYVESNKENMVIIGHNNVYGFIRVVLPISNTDWIETKIINYINIKELVKKLKSFSKEKIRLFVDDQNQYNIHIVKNITKNYYVKFIIEILFKNKKH